MFKKKKKPNKKLNRMILLASMPIAYMASARKIADAVKRAAGKDGAR